MSDVLPVDLYNVFWHLLDAAAADVRCLRTYDVMTKHGIVGLREVKNEFVPSTHSAGWLWKKGGLGRR